MLLQNGSYDEVSRAIANGIMCQLICVAFDLPLSGVRTVSRMIQSHVVVVPGRIIAAVAAVVAAEWRSAAAVHRRQKEVGVVALQWWRRFAVLRLGGLRLHVVVGTVATGRQLCVIVFLILRVLMVCFVQSVCVQVNA